MCPLETASAIQVLQGGKRMSNDFLGHINDPLNLHDVHQLPVALSITPPSDLEP